MATVKSGNLLVGQSGGCTAVINQTLAGIIYMAQKQKQIDKIYGMRNGILGVLQNNFIDLTNMSDANLKLLKKTPSSALGSCRHMLSDVDCGVVFNRLKKKNIRFLLLIGGNDTALTSKRLADFADQDNYDLKVIAVPKTIDNDLPCMDHTPGYGSNATFIACTTQEAGKDTEAMKDVDPVKIIEVMGRNSGWLVASAALGKRNVKDAPHLMYFPERAFCVDTFLNEVQDVYQRIGYVVVIISETIKDKNGRRIGERSAGLKEDSFGHKYVDSAAAILCRLVEEKLKIRARYDKPGTISRMSMNYISKVDQREAYLIGKAAVSYAVKGLSKVIVTLERVSEKPYKVKTSFVSVEKIAGIEKYLPDSFINKKNNFVTRKYINYAKPLVGVMPNFIRL